MIRFFVNFIALLLRLERRGRPDPAQTRILVIRRNRLGDMIYTLPLLHALRRNFPQAHLAVACDSTGADIARACPAVDEVIVLDTDWNPWLAVFLNASVLQDYDWVIAAKGGFDKRLALLTRLTNAAKRIGFDPTRPSNYYTDPVALPENPYDEHQIETLLRLLQPLKPTESPTAIDLNLRVPDASRDFAARILSRAPFAPSGRFMLINLSSTVPLKFRDDDFIAVIQRILDTTDLAVGLVSAPAGQPKAGELATRIASNRVSAVATPGPLDLAALLERAVCLLTPEGGAAHLAATVNTPTLVLWSEGPFKKWYSRGTNHAFVHAELGEQVLPVDRVWTALQPFLVPVKK